MQADCLCKFVAYGEGRDSRDNSPDDCRQTIEPVSTLPLLVVASCLSLPVSLSSVYGEGVVLGARPRRKDF